MCFVWSTRRPDLVASGVLASCKVAEVGMSFASSSRVKQRTRTEGRVRQASGDGKVGRDGNVAASESSHEVLSVVGKYRNRTGSLA